MFTPFQLNGGILEHWMTFIIVFLGSPDRMRNPHLRAKISEGLEAMLPPSAEQVQRANATSRCAIFLFYLLILFASYLSRITFNDFNREIVYPEC